MNPDEYVDKMRYKIPTFYVNFTVYIILLKYPIHKVQIRDFAVRF